MNDPVFVEAARVMAARVLAESTDDDARLERAWRLAVARRPSLEERDVLAALLADARGTFDADPTGAARLLAVGMASRGSDAPDAELAAWTQVCRVILNLHETYTRD